MMQPMSETVATLSLPIRHVDRGPVGQQLAQSTGHVNGWRFALVLTEVEMHFAFADRDGPRFAVDLNNLAAQATNAIEVLIGPRSPRRMP